MSRRPWKHAVEYFLFRGMFGAMSSMPASWRSRSATWLLRGAGRLRLDRLALENLDRAFGASLSQAEKRLILERVHVNLGKNFSEIASYLQEGPEFLRRAIVEDPSIDPIRKALKKKNGVVLVTPHFGNWELIPGWIALQGIPVTIVGKRLKNPRLQDFLETMRRKLGVEIVYQNESPRKLLRALSQNRVVGLLPDADTTRLDGIFLDFFGRPTYTPTGPASLSLVSGAPVIPLFLVRERSHHRILTEPGIEPSQGRRSEEEIRQISKHWSDAFERLIRKHPDHWMWFQRRWTTTQENVEGKRSKRQAARG